MILGGGSHHRRPANIYLLNALIEIRTRGHRVLERVEVDHHEINGSDIQLLKLSAVRIEAAISETPTLGAAMRSAGAALDDIPYARAVVLHLLWRRSILCDLTSALATHTVLELP